jgi:hypothetical protein
MPSPWVIAGMSGIHLVEIEYIKKKLVGEYINCHTPCTLYLMLGAVADAAQMTYLDHVAQLNLS